MNKLDQYIANQKEQYPGCLVLTVHSTFNNYLPGYDLKSSIIDEYIDGEIFVVLDEMEECKYKIVERPESHFRRSVLYSRDGDRIGYVKAHKKLFSKEYESIYHRDEHIFDYNLKYHNRFSIIELTYRKTKEHFFSYDYNLFYEDDEVMRKGRCKGRDVITIMDPSEVEECLLIYIAVHLNDNPKLDD